MSFGYSVGDVLAIIALANKIRKDFVGAPEQFKSINQDVRSLSIVIQDAYANLDHMSEGHAANFSEIIDTCQTLLHKLESMMSKWSVISDTSKSKTTRRLWKRLRWEPDEISDLRTQITSKITLLNAFNDQATSQNVAKLIHRSNNDEKQATLDWISSIDYIPQQNHLVSRLQANSRKWLFDSAEYQNWESQRGQVLFCPGDPGTGKTFTTAIVLETLQEQSQDNPDVLNTFVYCTYQSPDQDVHGLIASLFRNSLQQATNIPDAILSHCCRKQSAKHGLLRNEAIQHLEMLYKSFQKVTLLVDALDEVPTEVSRPFIAEILKLQKTCRFNLFVTSRHIPEIQNQFTAHGAAILEIRGSDRDIHRFLNDSIFQLPRFVARDPSFQVEIVERITEASSGMFLLAELHLRSLKNKKSPKALRASLAKLSIGSDAYDSAYQDAMTRISGLGPESETLAKQALLIIIFARESLRTEDLAYALSVEPDSEIIDDENVPDIDDIASICAGLIIVDQESNIVKLVHKSAQEYFERHQAQLFPRASETMARLCLQYLSLSTSTTDFDKRVEFSWPPFRKYAHMNWAYHSRCAERDNEATKEADVDLDKSMIAPDLHSVSTLAIDLLAKDLAGSLSSALENACREGRHALVELLLTVNDYDLNCGPTMAFVASPKSRRGMWVEMETTSEMEQENGAAMHGCLYRGKNASLHAWTSGDIILEPCVKKGEFLLLKAAEMGHDSIVRILLRHGADPNKVSPSGLTALYIAANFGHEKAVLLLLEQPTIDPECKCRRIRKFDNLGPAILWTPLLAAVKGGHLRCAKLLLDRTNRNYRDELGRNVACLAAKNGDSEMLKELLKWSDIEFDPAEGIKCRSALEIALRESKEEAALVLIPHSDAKRVYRGGNRPLNLAATAKSGKAIQLLFSQGALVNAKGRKGRTVLHTAAMTGDDETIKLILVHPDIDTNLRDDEGNTPLMELLQWLLDWASQSRSFERKWSRYKDMILRSMHLLLSRPELDINAQNLEGDTAVLMAASFDDTVDSGDKDSIFNAIFYHHGVNREHRDEFGQTVLSHAVMAGSQRVQTILKETQLMYQFSEIQDDGETLLSLAAEHEWDGQLKWEDIVNMSPPEFMDRKDNEGKTPEEVRDDARKHRYELQQHTEDMRQQQRRLGMADYSSPPPSPSSSSSSSLCLDPSTDD
ncbi:unnamed protein product [Fusarium graminearum]|uniref:NACHT domain-containing protein n=1 Tax=Gibberella zeae TaxID=5518 RepID=A0A9N8WTE2_GIBZA|nr:hypothetical protein FG05_30169 [Fusarium graminearum]CAG1985923.1 unnamed protein product [Fusarium graminearum]